MIDRGDRFAITSLVLRPRFRRLAFHAVMEHGERVPPAEAIEMLADAAGCDAFPGFAHWIRTTKTLARADAEQTYPIRIAWAEHDRTIPFQRYGRPVLDVLAGAEHITLESVGHVPMFDDPALVARTILQVTRSPEFSANHGQLM